MGVGAISGMIKYHRTAIQIIGGVVLIVFGLRLYSTTPHIENPPNGEDPERLGLSAYVLDISKTFLLTITNPGAVLGLFAMFGGVGAFVEVRGSIDALVLVAAIAAGISERPPDGHLRYSRTKQA